MGRIAEILSIAILVPLAGCDSRASMEAQAKATAEARAFFHRFSVPTPDNQAKWGMREFRVLGFGTVFGRFTWLTQVKKLPGEANRFEVTIPIWCSGLDANGQSLKLRRSILLVVAERKGGEGFEVLSHEFKDRPLSTAMQLGVWVALSIGAMIAVGLLFMVCLSYVGRSRVRVSGTGFALATWVVGLAAIGYVSYGCFGTVLATILATVACTVFFFGLSKLLRT